MTFPCSGCGLCCKNISGIQELRVFDTGNGVCKNLNYEGQCNIYETRPEVCRVGEMYEKHYKDSYSRNSFYEMNAIICNDLQQKNKIDTKFRVKIRG